MRKDVNSVGENNYPSLHVLVFWKCLADNEDIIAHPCARNPPKCDGNLQKSMMKHLPPLPTCWGSGRGGGMWKEVVGASLRISVDVQWILVDFVHVDLLFHHIWHTSGLEMPFWHDV